MLSILLVWIIILLSNFFTGFAFLNLFPKYKNANIPKSLTVIVGLCVQGVLCNILYLFIPVNYKVFWAFTLVLVVWWLINYKLNILTFFVPKKRFGTFGLFITLLAFGYAVLLAAAPAFFFDEQFYYVSTVQWIQKYPVVKGLAHLHKSFGLMSSWHLLTAFYAMPFGEEVPLQELNAYLYLVFFIYTIEAKSCFSKVTYHTLLVFFILFNGTMLSGFISSASPDTAGAFLIAIILSVLLEYENKNDQASILKICMLVLVVFTISVKITNFFLAPLLFFLLKMKKRALLVMLIFTGVNLGVYLLRNLFLTGYLFYPFTSFGGFPVDWEVGGLLNTGYFFWYYRFATTDSWHTMLYLRFFKYNAVPVVINYVLTMLFLLIGFIIIGLKIIRKHRLSGKGLKIYEWLIKHKYSISLASLGVLIHVFLIPSFKSTYVIRFIFGPVFWLNAFLIAMLLIKIKRINVVYKALLVLIIIGQLGKDIKGNTFKNLSQFWLFPTSYQAKVSLNKHKSGNQLFYITPKDSHFCGGHFPCVSNKNFRLRGERLEIGFKKAIAPK